MKKWIITWDCGWGRNDEIIEAASEDAARSHAYEQARDEFENNADYDAIPYTKEEAVDRGLESEDE